jgi:hypothetical protein
MFGMSGWGEPFGIARKTMSITRIQAMANMGSLYFLNTDGVCKGTGSCGGGGGAEYTIGGGGEMGVGDACGRYGEAVCCAGSCRGVPQFSQNDWPGSAFVPHMGQKGILSTFRVP